MKWRDIAVLLTLAVFAAASTAYAGNNLEFFARPIPLGVPGQNGVVNFDPNSKDCLIESGTLGALVTDGSNLYILGVAHVLALGSGGYLSSGSLEPIIQPDLVTATNDSNNLPPPYHAPSCPPVGNDVTQFEVAQLTAVIPINFTSNSSNTYDAALAQTVPGMVSSSIIGLGAFSGTALSPLRRGTKVQKVGAWSGLTHGKYLKVLKSVHHKFCSQLYTKANASGLCSVDLRSGGG